jgi:hypothetical protein
MFLFVDGPLQLRRAQRESFSQGPDEDAGDLLGRQLAWYVQVRRFGAETERRDRGAEKPDVANAEVSTIASNLVAKNRKNL